MKSAMETIALTLTVNGEEVTADELAEKLGTINYEVVTSIASRVPRVLPGAP